MDIYFPIILEAKFKIHVSSNEERLFRDWHVYL